MEPSHLTFSNKNTDLSKLKRAYIEEQWTKLLLDWVRICGQAHESLEEVDFIDLVQMYGEDIFVHSSLPHTFHQFMRQTFPKFQLKRKKDLDRVSYLTATVLLYHCVTNGPVNVVINICLYLSLEQQNLVRRFCEQLKDVEITVANLDAAIDGAFESTSEIQEKHEEPQNSEVNQSRVINAPAKTSLIAKQPADEGQLLPETSIMASAVSENTKCSLDITSKEEVIHGNSTRGIAESMKKIQSCENPDETRIDTKISTRNHKLEVASTKILISKKADNELETEDCTMQSSLESLKTPDSKLNKLEASATQTMCTTEEDSNRKKKSKITYPRTLRFSENTDPEPKKQAPIEQSGNTNTLYLNSTVTIQSSDCESLGETTSEFINDTSIALESRKLKHAMTKSTSVEEEKNKKRDNESIGLQPLGNSDLDSIKIVDTESEEIIDMLYSKSPFLVNSSAFGYSGEISSEIQSDSNMTTTAVAGSNDFIKRHLHVASTKVLLNYIKDNMENKNQDITDTSRKPNIKPKKRETNTAREIIDKIFTSRIIDVMKYSETEIIFLATSESADIPRINLTDNINLDDEEIEKDMNEYDDRTKNIIEFLKNGHIPEGIKTGEIFMNNRDHRCSATHKQPSIECSNQTKSEIEIDTNKNIETVLIKDGETQSTSKPLNQPDRELKKADVSTSAEEIDTLHLNHQFMTKSSAFGYLAKTCSEKRRIVGLPLITADEYSRESKSGLDMSCKPYTEKERSELKVTDNSMPNLAGDQPCAQISGNLEPLKQSDPEPNKTTAGAVSERADSGDMITPYNLSEVDLERNCFTSRMKTIHFENSNESVEKGHSVINKWLDLKVWKNAVKKMLVRNQEVELNYQGNTCENLNANRKEDKQMYYLYRFQGWSMKKLPSISFRNRANENLWEILVIAFAIMVVLSILLAFLVYFWSTESDPDGNSEFRVFTSHDNLLNSEEKNSILFQMKSNPNNNWFNWECKNGLCQKANQSVATGYFKSLSQCTLLCSGPQLWPYPTGLKFFGRQIVALAKNKLRYKYKTVPSQTVHEYLNKTFILFQRNLARLEVTDLKEASLDLVLKELYIEIYVFSDRDPRLRLDTNESYALTVNTTDKVNVAIKSPSFCGVRHGLETLSQLILLDQSTGHLITLTNVTIKDTPSYKYRGLMVDTARNCIPLIDLLRTIDTMSMSKLNTFHWRISEATFPTLKSNFPQLFEYSDYEKEMVYTTDDIKLLVKHAGYRGIRVLIEVAAPEPGSRAFSWLSDATKEKSNLTSNLCARLKMRESVFYVLEAFYSYIIRLTEVNDVYHLSNSLFLFVECFDLMEDRERFLEKAQANLRSANKGTLPKLPVIWYNANLTSKLGWMWHDFGVQLHEDKLPESTLSKYKIIQSSKWNLSCKMAKHRCVKYKTWQEMYGWKKWRNLDALSVEGGEAVLWTDLVDTNNLDSHLWPRASAVAERLWSDAVANQSASVYEYLRIDAQRWRMLIRGVKVQPIWPVWCNFNPGQCFAKIKT